jgi:hypothetical protein
VRSASPYHGSVLFGSVANVACEVREKVGSVSDTGLEQPRLQLWLDDHPQCIETVQKVGGCYGTARIVAGSLG